MCICKNHQNDIIIKVNSLPPGKEYRTSGFPSLGQRRWKVWRLFVREEIMRQFLKYTTLSILGTMGISCYILADTFFIAQGLGTEGLAALNLAIPVYNFIYGTALMLGMGGAIKFAILKSQGNQNQINTVYTNTIYLAVIFSAVFMLLGIFGSGTLARLLGAEGVVFEMTKTYLKCLSNLELKIFTCFLRLTILLIFFATFFYQANTICILLHRYSHLQAMLILPRLHHYPCTTRFQQ